MLNSFNSIISKPLNRDKKKAVTYCSVLFVLLSSVIAAIPLFLIGATYDDQFHFISPTVFHVYSVLIPVTLIIPVILIIIVYSMTGIALKSSTFKHENNRAMELRKRENMKVLKMFLEITISFVILTVPFGIWSLRFYSMVWHTSSNIQIKTEFILLSVFSTLFCTNFSINPIIYAKMHREVNQFLRRLIKRVKTTFCLRCSKRNQLSSFVGQTGKTTASLKRNAFVLSVDRKISIENCRSVSKQQNPE